jgi:peptide/nickel transport system permease protein
VPRYDRNFKFAALGGHIGMIAYLLRSLAQAVVVMLAVALIAFAMFRFVGDPVASMVGQEASRAAISACRTGRAARSPI